MRRVFLLLLVLVCLSRFLGLPRTANGCAIVVGGELHGEVGSEEIVFVLEGVHGLLLPLVAKLMKSASANIAEGFLGQKGAQG